jgi:taurine dioxygenase
MSEPTIVIEPVSPIIGCEVSGVDLSKPLSAFTIEALRDALLDSGVIFIRDQDISPAQQMTVAQAFGEPDEYPFVGGLPGYPCVTPVLKLAHETVNFGGLWHSDTTYQECPPMGTILHARTLPPVGGDTLFASMSAAYEALSDGFKEMLSGLKAVNSAHKSRVTDTRSNRVKDTGKDTQNSIMEALHPVVRTHPETGKKALYVNGAHTTRFEGMTVQESEGLLNFLFHHQVREEFTCRLRWTPGSIAFWDNRCTQHFPLNDYTGHERLLHRITLKGDVPR